MATYNTIRKSGFNQDYTSLSCDICGSIDIIETTEEYVCRSCGIVLEIQKLQYDRPYNDDIVQYARLGTTQIGTRRERLVSPNSSTLNRLNKHNSTKDNEKVILERARIEISRVFTCLDLADYDDVKEFVFTSFKKAREKLRPGSKYRNVQKLVSVVSYLCLKLRNVPINPVELIKSSDIKKKEFNEFILQVQKYIPKYAERNRQEYVLQRVLEITQHFELGMPFFYQSKKIMFKLWESIKNTTDHVIAGLVSSISILCSYRDQVSVSSICNLLAIRMSTIQSQIKKKIFEKFKVQGFVSLVRSSELLSKVMEKLGLLNMQQLIEGQEENAAAEKVDIVFGKAIQIFNPHNNIEYYFFAFRSEDNRPIIIFIDLHHPLMNYEVVDAKKVRTKKLFDFEIVRYFRTKDPPVITT